MSVEGFKSGPDIDNNARFNEVSAGYFRTLGVPLLAGREFTTSDVAGAPKLPWSTRSSRGNSISVVTRWASRWRPTRAQRPSTSRSSGLGVALALGRTAQSLLFGLAPHDPVVVIASIIVLTLVALAAGFLPAYRASTVDPITALRYE